MPVQGFTISSDNHGQKWVKIVRNIHGAVAVRDSKRPCGRVLVFAAASGGVWVAGPERCGASS
ncbi:DUF397 domain-containing protein [Streptomyces sp. NPDC001493]